MVYIYIMYIYPLWIYFLCQVSRADNNYFKLDESEKNWKNFQTDQKITIDPCVISVTTIACSTYIRIFLFTFKLNSR